MRSILACTIIACLAIPCSAQTATAPVVLNGGGGEHYYPDIAINEKGSAVVVWHSSTDDHKTWHVNAAFLKKKRSGYQVKKSIQLSGSYENNVYPNVAWNPRQEQFAVVWEAKDGNNSYVQMQNLSKKGKQIGDPVVLVTAPYGLLFNPVVIANNNDKRGKRAFLISWAAYNINGTPGLYGQFLSAEGAMQKKPRLLMKNAVSSIGGRGQMQVTDAIQHASGIYYIALLRVQSENPNDRKGHLLRVKKNGKPAGSAMIENIESVNVNFTQCAMLSDDLLMATTGDVSTARTTNQLFDTSLQPVGPVEASLDTVIGKSRFFRSEGRVFEILAVSMFGFYLREFSDSGVPLGDHIFVESEIPLGAQFVLAPIPDSSQTLVIAAFQGELSLIILDVGE